MTNYGQKLKYLFAMLKQDKPVTIKASGNAISQAIRMSCVVRSRIGDLHQVTTLHELKDGQRETHGIEILISKNSLDQDSVGYQAPEPQGFYKPTFKKRQSTDADKAKKTSEPEKAAEVVKAKVEEKVERAKKKPKKEQAAEKKQAETQVVAEVVKEVADDKTRKKSASDRRRNKRKSKP